ncbi:UNVERIFIED_ORG: hypothetical protein BCL66_105292 [Martelella mediterranea]
MAPDIPPKKARQGRRSLRIFLILAVSTGLAIAAWAIAEIYYSIALDPENAMENGNPPAVERPSSSDRDLPPAND